MGYNEIADRLDPRLEGREIGGDVGLDLSRTSSLSRSKR